MSFPRIYDRRRLFAAIRSGASDKDAAAILGCSATHATQLRRAAGLPSNGRRLWTAPEMSRLVELLEDGRSHAEIAVALNRPVKGIGCKATRLRLGVSYNPRRLRYRERAGQVWDLLATGERTQAIANRLGIPKRTVRRYRQAMPAWWRREMRAVQSINTGADRP